MKLDRAKRAHDDEMTSGCNDDAEKRLFKLLPVFFEFSLAFFMVIAIGHAISLMQHFFIFKKNGKNTMYSVGLIQWFALKTHRSISMKYFTVIYRCNPLNTVLSRYMIVTGRL